MIRMNIVEMYQLLASARAACAALHKNAGSFIRCDFQNWYETHVAGSPNFTTSLYQQALICIVENASCLGDKVLAPVRLHQDKVGAYYALSLNAKQNSHTTKKIQMNKREW